VLAEAKSLKEQ